jgi:hypothetical protein
MMTKEQWDAFNAILDQVEEWQMKGRTGFCLPVIRGDLLTKLEELVDERRRDKCTFCYGTGFIQDYEDKWKCTHCMPPPL